MEENMIKSDNSKKYCFRACSEEIKKAGGCSCLIREIEGLPEDKKSL